MNDEKSYVNLYDRTGHPIPHKSDPNHPIYVFPISHDRPVYLDGTGPHDMTKVVESRKTVPAIQDASDTSCSSCQSPLAVDQDDEYLRISFLSKSEEGVPAPGLSCRDSPHHQTRSIVPETGKMNMQALLPAHPASNGRKQINASSHRQTPYDLAMELLAQIPMRIVGEALYIFNGKYYSYTPMPVAYRIIMAFCRESVKNFGDSSIIKRIYDVILSEPRICTHSEKSPEFLSFNNGLLDLRSFLLRPHTPDIFVTAHVEGVFRSDSAPFTPLFDEFLQTITGAAPELEQRIYELIGYTLTPDTQAKCFFVLQGVRDSGKSKLGELIASFSPRRT